MIAKASAPPTPDDIARCELQQLRDAIAVVPADKRTGFARLCVLILLLDMPEPDRNQTLNMILQCYFPSRRGRS